MRRTRRPFRVGLPRDNQGIADAAQRRARGGQVLGPGAGVGGHVDGHGVAAPGGPDVVGHARGGPSVSRRSGCRGARGTAASAAIVREPFR